MHAWIRNYQAKLGSANMEKASSDIATQPGGLGAFEVHDWRFEAQFDSSC
jgi:hypothetical protein